MFTRFVRPDCKNLKSLCMFLIMLQSSMKLPVAGAARFEMCGVLRFLHAKAQTTIRILLNWSLKIQNELPPPLWVRIGLNCNFILWDTSEVDFKGKMTEKWFGIPSNWSLKIQNGIPPSLWVWIGLNCIFSFWDTSEVDSRGKTEKQLST